MADIKQIVIGTETYNIEPYTSYVTLSTQQDNISGRKTFTNSVKISGRYQGSGDDEGLIIGKAENNYAGLCLGNPSGIRSVLYLKPDNTAIWRWTPAGSDSYDIAHPGKAGTIALTSDITTAIGNIIDSEETYKTFKKVAEYITDDKTGAAKMIADIAANTTAIANEKTRAEGTESGLSTRISTNSASIDTLEGYFTNGIANTAAKLSTVSKTAWGKTFWTSGGIPASIDGDMTNVGSITMEGSIKYKGAKSTYSMIKFIDNTGDTYGNGISIGGGGTTIIGGGESSDLFITAGSGGSEKMIIANDGDIEFYSNCQNGIDTAKSMTLDTNGTLTAPKFSGPLAGNASSASAVAVTNAHPNNTAYIPMYTAVTGDLSPQVANSFYIWSNTTTPCSYLNVGKSDWFGGLSLHSNTDKYTNLVPTKDLDNNNTITLPGVTGTVYTTGNKPTASDTNALSYSTTALDNSTSVNYLIGKTTVATNNNTYYNTNIYTKGSKLYATGGLESAGVIVTGGADLSLRAGSTNTADAGDVVYADKDGKELGCIWMDGKTLSHRWAQTEAGSPGSAYPIVLQGTATGNYIPKFNATYTKIIENGWQVRNNSTTHLEYADDSTDGGYIPTIRKLKYWNGRYNSTTSSLNYCARNIIVGTDTTACTENAVPRYDGNGGAKIKTTGVTIDDSNNIQATSFTSDGTSKISPGYGNELNLASNGDAIYIGYRNIGSTAPSTYRFCLGNASDGGGGTIICGPLESSGIKEGGTALSSKYGAKTTVDTNTSNITTLQGYFTGGVAKEAAKTSKAVTFNNGGSGAASGTTFDGSTARTISYNTIGALGYEVKTNSSKTYIIGKQTVSSGDTATYYHSNIYFTGNSLYAYNIYATSDERLKTNIINSTLDYYDIIGKMRLVEYNWKSKESDTNLHHGVLAQELIKILPTELRNHFVSDGEYLSISDGKLAYLALGALQQQLEINKQLEERIAKLEKLLGV